MFTLPLRLCTLLVYLLALAIGLILWMGIRLEPVYAANIMVTSNSDTTAADGVCTLREAIQAANINTVVNECAAGSGYDTITFDPSLTGQTIILGSALNPTTDMTIDASAAP